MFSLGRLLADYASTSFKLYSVDVTSLAAVVNIYGLRNDCALQEVTGDGFDTAEVWGANLHAPTNFMSRPLTELATSPAVRNIPADFPFWRLLADSPKSPHVCRDVDA